MQEQSCSSSHAGAATQEQPRRGCTLISSRAGSVSSLKLTTNAAGAQQLLSSPSILGTCKVRKLQAASWAQHLPAPELPNMFWTPAYPCSLVDGKDLQPLQTRSRRHHYSLEAA